MVSEQANLINQSAGQTYQVTRHCAGVVVGTSALWVGIDVPFVFKNANYTVDVTRANITNVGNMSGYSVDEKTVNGFVIKIIRSGLTLNYSYLVSLDYTITFA